MVRRSNTGFISLMKSAATLVLGYAAVCAYVYAIQESLIFFPLKGDYALPSGSGYAEVYFPTSDGVMLSGWFIDSGSETTVLYFHGNGGNIASNLDSAETFKMLGLNAFFVDYRWYGMSRGAITEENDVYRDAESAFDYLVSKGADPKKIVVWGRSLWGAPAAYVAENREAWALVLESTFASMEAMAEERFWFLPTDVLLKYRFRSAERLSNVRESVLVIHSPEDEVIGFSNGTELYSAANSPKSFLRITGTHNGGHSDSLGTIVAGAGDFLKSQGLLVHR